MAGWYRFLATSDHWIARSARAVRRSALNFSVPAPRLIAVPLRSAITGVRFVYYMLMRAFVCEPFFKSYCTSYGRNLRTGVFLHWVQGKGDLIVGDNVVIDGRCHFIFASRYHERPTLIIGSNSGMGYGCAFTVGKKITLGNHVRLGSSVVIFDVPGHPADPEARKLGKEADPEDVRPVTIEDNVWIGTNSTIYPGVTIGENSIVSSGSVVMSSVPANVLVAGNPARQVRSLVSGKPETAKEAVLRP